MYNWCILSKKQMSRNATFIFNNVSSIREYTGTKWASAIFLKPWQINKFDWELYIGSPASVPAEFDTRGQFSQSLFKVSCSDIQDGVLQACATLCEYTLDLFLNGGKSKLSVIKFYTQLRSHLSLCLHTCEGDFEPFALRVLQLVDSHLLTNISYTWWKTHLDKW